MKGRLLCYRFEMLHATFEQENLVKAVSMAFVRTCKNADCALTLIKEESTCGSRRCGNSAPRVLNSFGVLVRWFAGGGNLRHDAAIDLAEDSQ